MRIVGRGISQMVTYENAQCPGKKWYDRKRCEKTQCEGKKGEPCDFLNLEYDKDKINERIEYEQAQLQDLMEQKKRAKSHAQKDELKRLNRIMTDKVIGVIIMQEALMKDFGVSAFKSALHMLKAKRKIQRLKQQLDYK